MEDYEILSSVDYEYTEEEVQQLRIRAVHSRIDRVTLNRYELSHTDIFSEMKSLIEEQIKILIIEPLKIGQLSVKEGGELESLLALVDKIPKIRSAVDSLGSTTGKSGKKSEPEQESTISSALKEHRDAIH